jgi:hypothetical protein
MKKALLLLLGSLSILGVSTYASMKDSSSDSIFRNTASSSQLIAPSSFTVEQQPSATKVDTAPTTDTSVVGRSFFQIEGWQWATSSYSNTEDTVMIMHQGNLPADKHGLSLVYSKDESVRIDSTKYSKITAEEKKSENGVVINLLVPSMKGGGVVVEAIDNNSIFSTCSVPMRDIYNRTGLPVKTTIAGIVFEHNFTSDSDANPMNTLSYYYRTVEQGICYNIAINVDRSLSQSVRAQHQKYLLAMLEKLKLF